MAITPFPGHRPQDPFGGGDAQASLVRYNLDSATEGGSLGVPGLGLLQLLLPAADVVDDRDLFGAIAFQGAHAGILFWTESQAHWKAHERGQQRFTDILLAVIQVLTQVLEQRSIAISLGPTAC